jgi:serine/threonine protein kinase
MDKRHLEGARGTYRLGEVIERDRHGNAYRAYRIDGTGGALYAVETSLHFEEAHERRLCLDEFDEMAARYIGLEHPRVASVIDFVSDHHCHYTIYSHLEGVRLSLLLEKHCVPAGELQLVRLAADIAAGLKFLHEQPQPLWLGNLSPASVMVRQDGRAVLGDLGLTRMLTRRRAGEPWRGTPGYAAPEQHGSAARLDGRSDIYALGAILWQVVTLCDPQTWGMPLAPLHELDAPVAAWFDEFVTRCLQEDAALRFASADAALAFLRSHEPALHESRGLARWLAPLGRLFGKSEPVGA